ncbi:MAG: glycosyltransferase [Candidatus Falkowbacteria bacterium]
MKIGLINNLYKPYNRGGAERIVELMATELRQSGQTVFIISTKPRTRKDLEESGVYYLESSYSDLSKWPYLKRLFWQLGNLVNLKKYHQVSNILKKEQPELIISHNLMGLGLLIPLAIKKSSARHIQVLHDIQLLHPSGLMYFGQEKILKSVMAKIYQRVTAVMFSSQVIIVSPSKWLLNLHLSCGLFKKNKKLVIANPFSDGKPAAARSKSFIFVGQLEYHKGLDLFAAAAARFTDYNFLVVGDGSLKDITETSNLKLLGRKNPENVSQLLSDSLALIIPSRCYENSPTVIYEAAAVKTPVIAANLGGIPELIERFGGLLFEPDNLDSLIMAITEFIAKGVSSPPLPINENYTQKILAQL